MLSMRAYGKCRFRRSLCCLSLFVIAIAASGSSGGEKVFPGADEKTPSAAMYFDWINHAWEGANELSTMANLDFFKWLCDEYGMKLDIYLLDAGTIDGWESYGSMESESFRKRFPNGLKPIYEKAKSFDWRIGMWLGPDGYGDTPEQEKARGDILIKLCRDFDCALFKFDACCGDLRKGKIDTFIRNMKACRNFSPDLIALNHRIKLSEQGKEYMTTWLWEGAETYIDVHMPSRQAATHHRVGALSRGLPPGLSRLTEDHGVCLSSCLDYWEDDLILQAFNRCLVLAPEIYGNPWLLRDDEFAKLARIYNLHRRYGEILVNGMVLPERYGPHAVSRGDESTRFVTMRNLTWNPTKYPVKLDSEIGLTSQGDVELRQFHPSEKILGTFKYGSTIEVEVSPFRSCLVMAATERVNEVGVFGCDYDVVRDMPGKPVIIKLMGLAGTEAEVKLAPGDSRFSGAILDGKANRKLLGGKSVEVKFPGKAPEDPFHRKLGDLTLCDVPADAEALYEATCFAADNDALEVRSLRRSGPTKVPQVQRARDAFLNQTRFREIGIWDKNLFDGNLETFFHSSEKYQVGSMKIRGIIRGGALRLDFGEPVRLDKLVIKTIDGQYDGLVERPAAVSADLKSWIPISLMGNGTTITAEIEADTRVRYLRIGGYFGKVAEIEGYYGDTMLDRSAWRASLVFGLYENAPAVRAWSLSCTLDEVTRNSYLAVAIHGSHGAEGAYAAIRMDNKYIGAPDRSVSYHTSAWEAGVREHQSNYTYYIPVTSDMEGERIDVVVLGVDEALSQPERVESIRPEVWITAYPAPFETKELVLER
ncbi:MAG TPA: discoidin domain-containing protein [Sedimentisphaerales bacterium]|nr:discoidin domain-containing protein [Sedimentisphaerales bacterium]